MLEKTIAHLTENGDFDRIKKATALTDVFFKVTSPIPVTEEYLKKAHKEAHKQSLLEKFAKNKELLEIMLDEVTDEIVKIMNERGIN